MNRYRRLLLALAVLAGVVESAAAKSPALPDWVLQAANAKLPEYPPSTKAVVLLEDKMLTVRPDGKAVERYRSVIKILRQQGRSYATVVVPFSNDYKLNTLHVWSIGPDGRQYTVKDDQIREEGNDEWGMLYVDERAKIVVPPGADPNGIVAYESEQTLPAYLNEEGWYFQNPIPSVHSVFDEHASPAGNVRRRAHFCARARARTLRVSTPHGCGMMRKCRPKYHRTIGIGRCKTFPASIWTMYPWRRPRERWRNAWSYISRRKNFPKGMDAGQKSEIGTTTSLRLVLKGLSRSTPWPKA